MSQYLGLIRYISLDKSGYPVNIFFYFLAKTYVVGTH